ncbi:MAG TPA: fumarylacetoacetate hydrolase family protein [Pyrinomonadaceae bacterium]|nr:fumarylacetoacetate hydrolase family protein [Pyrinomonadaceae bacterium]
MRIATFEIDGTSRLGLVVGEEADGIIDLGAALETARGERNGASEDMLGLIRSWNADFAKLIGEAATGQSGLVREQTKLRAPLERPGKLICLAGNYREHIVESGYEAPLESDVITQQLFLKPATAIIGDRDEIVISENNVTVGWETELAIIIGKGGRRIPARAALDHVFGYTILNDISERGLNSRIENRRKRELDRFFDWLAGKWFDGFAPSGPWIVTADEIGDPHNLNIRLWVNDQLRQEGNTRDMIFRIEDQIAYSSSIMTLEPGDIISTGTPVGAGIGGDASLQAGDELVCEIEKIGTLRNRVTVERQAQ